MTFSDEVREAAIISAITQQFESVADPVPQSNPILQFGSSRFILSQPIEVTVRQEEGLWYIKSADLGIEAFADTKEDTELSFYEDFDALYSHLAAASDDSLTPEARKIKQAFQKLVVSKCVVTIA